jgi:hypothetical protein
MSVVAKRRISLLLDFASLDEDKREAVLLGGAYCRDSSFAEAVRCLHRCGTIV